MIYKNLSFGTKTFYGVTFKPGESHEVSGFIHDPNYVVVDVADPVPTSTTKTTKSSTTSTSASTATATSTKASE